MKQEIEDRIKNVIKGCLGEVDIEKINDETNLVDAYGADSIDIVQLVVDLECEFSIEFPDEYLLVEKIAPYKELVSTMEELLSGDYKVISYDEN